MLFKRKHKDNVQAVYVSNMVYSQNEAARIVSEIGYKTNKVIYEKCYYVFKQYSKSKKKEYFIHKYSRNKYIDFCIEV